MTTRSGLSTAITRVARLFRSSRTACSSRDSSIVPLVLDTQPSNRRCESPRSVATPPDAGESRHARIVPAAHVVLLNQSEQLALAQSVYVRLRRSKLDLLGMIDAQLVDVPVVQRPVILKLQRADGVRDALDGVRLAVSEIVHRVDAPFVARAVVFGVKDAVQSRGRACSSSAKPCLPWRARSGSRRETRPLACARTDPCSRRPADRGRDSFGRVRSRCPDTPGSGPRSNRRRKRCRRESTERPTRTTGRSSRRHRKTVFQSKPSQRNILQDRVDVLGLFLA